MVKTDVFYLIKCNRCGRIYINEDGEQYYGDKFEALDDAIEDGWLIVDNEYKQYCPNCLTEDGEIKQPYPNEVLAIEKFVKEFIIKMRGEDYHIIEEMDNGSYLIYTLLSDYVKQEGVTDVEKEMIRQLAGKYKAEINITNLDNTNQKKLDIIIS